MEKRIVALERNTKETQIKLSLNLDGTGKTSIETGVGFFDHMLDLMAFHGMFDLDIKAKGDLVVCDHHLVEDVGIIFGKAFLKALGDKRGIRRYGTFFLPMDESLAQVSLDISGRSFLVFDCNFNRESIGNFSTEMVKEFFRAFAFNSEITLHERIIYGENDHHKIEALFKATGRAIREAKEVDKSNMVIPSSKGML
ncbi:MULTISPECIES: imidazoleglycerol-phosphate dehydratase HisB [Clostridium]|uniref:Imidazoleglycerol-phosphate dehydratase n=1 Tax=Clostridium cibarium TaxID=2762247 RepID=A0ABR8PXX1_9CLOT|nr:MULTISPECIES: imidazoleglycerol-phosphate dehydratase HisB [Clostridium]MBD7913016.1 imidazoleglycerol-phosphate dehydratase HisB [Clostridium cibarium]